MNKKENKTQRHYDNRRENLGEKIKIILVYFDSNKDKSGKDFENNRNLEREVKSELEVPADTGIILLEDFNAHLPILGHHP